jgi:hypothetical protein
VNGPKAKRAPAKSALRKLRLRGAYHQWHFSQTSSLRPFGFSSNAKADSRIASTTRGTTMSNDILEAKRKLPLPALLHQLGFGQQAKKSARCPFHDDGRNSFSIWPRNGVWFWKCHTGCGEGDEITFLEKHRGISRGEAIKVFLEMAAVNGASSVLSQHLANRTNQQQPFDWQKCVEAFSDTHLEQLAEWRGYSREFVSWLRTKA